MKRKLVVMCAALVFAFIFMPSFVFADDINVTVNGEIINFDGQQPVIIDGRTLVPVRGVFEALGFDVDWNQETRRVTLTRENARVDITINSTAFTANGRAYALEVPAQIIDGSTMLPIRSVLESVGYVLDWDGGSRTIAVSRYIKTDLVVAVQALAWSMDPIVHNGSATNLNNNMLFSSLLTMNVDTMEIEPGLAIAWNMPNASTVNMELRRGVTFHNGDPLTAHDVKFSLERASHSADMWAITEMLSHVTVIDDYNFTVHLHYDFVPILRNLAHVGFSIVPMDYMTRIGEEAFAENPIGTGSFMLEELLHWERIKMVRNDNYWGEIPRIETLTFIAIPDQQWRLLALEAGEVDIVDSVSTFDLEWAEASPDINVVRRPNLSNNYIGFNAQSPYLSNPLVRQAINYAIDAQMIIDVVLEGAGLPTDSFVSNLAWGHHAVEPFDVNLDRARELMAEAGLEDGFHTTIWYNIPNWQREQIAEIIAVSLRPLNIIVEVVGMEWIHFLDATGMGEHDMFILGWVSVTGDADYGLFPLFHSSQFGSAGNRTFWSSPEVDALLEAGRRETDPENRLAIYAEIQEILRDEAPWILLNQGETLMATAPNVQGFTIAPWGHHNFATVWFD